MLKTHKQNTVCAFCADTVDGPFAILLSTTLFFLVTSMMMMTLMMTVMMRKFEGNIMFSPYIYIFTSICRLQTKKGEKRRRCCCEPVFKGNVPVLNIAARLERQREREREKDRVSHTLHYRNDDFTMKSAFSQKHLKCIITLVNNNKETEPVFSQICLSLFDYFKHFMH